MTNLISQAFKNDEKKLVTFVTGGDPDFETSLQIINTIINNGADIIEIGMPFSDPMADGPTIQLSSNRAISKGINLENIFSLASEAKKTKMPNVTVEGAELIFEIGNKVKEDFDDKKLPLMIAMINAILEDKKLNIKWENFN